MTSSRTAGISKVVAALFASALLSAASANPVVDPWKDASVRSGVPLDILHGIALAETAKVWSDGTTRPWPWTLNSSRGSMFFKTKIEAAIALRDILASGITNVDIGLMQINCGYHCRRVSDPADLLDPTVNLRVAADILIEARNVKGDLAKSVGAYHAGFDSSRARRSQWYQDTVASYVRRLRRRA